MPVARRLIMGNQRYIEAEWKEFLEMCEAPFPIPKSIERDARKIFFAGAIALRTVLVREMGERNRPSDVPLILYRVMSVLEQTGAEGREFVALAEHGVL